jgi:phage-related minor tail protein
MTAAGRDEYTRIADAIYAASRALADMQAAEAKTFGAGAKSAIRSYIADLEDVAGATEQAFTNAFKGMEDALVSFVMTGKLDFKSLATSILQDMARMAIQASIMRPLMGMFGGMFGMSAAPVAVATPIPTGFANGGIMTSRGSVPLNAYANGGIANSPQMALFGEGRLPEAYVPLPDGRTIPVTMQGGAGVGNNVTVNVSVENGGEQVKSNQGAGELGRAIAGAVRQELINQKRPGGLLAA